MDFMTSSFEEKIQKIKIYFSNAKDTEEKYELIIKLGRELNHLGDTEKTKENKIEGCQSNTFVKSSFENGKVFFEATSDALISSGLASILISVYSGEEPSIILKNKPDFLKDIGIEASISPNRANGLYEMFTRMQKDALLYETKKGA